MPDPVSLAILLKIAAGAAGKVGVKIYLAGKLAGLKAFLVSTLGPSMGGASAAVITAAATAAFWVKYVKKGSDEDAIKAAMKKGASRSVAEAILRWFRNNF